MNQVGNIFRRRTTKNKKGNMVNHMSMSFIQQAFVKYLKKKKKLCLHELKSILKRTLHTLMVLKNYRYYYAWLKNYD